MDNMKKITTQFLSLLFVVSVSASSVSAASLPAMASEPTPASQPAATTATAEPDPEVKSALEDFKNLSKSEKKTRLKEAKKAFKALKAKRGSKREMDEDVRLVLAVIFAILIPPLGVWIKEKELTLNTLIALLLCILAFITWALWLIPVIFALLVVFDVISVA
jgi:uncharacterized membrane protein YqaE (UPF0057 family)